MASSNEDGDEGYDVSRFEAQVRPELLCGICRDVPKDPRLCQKEHLFCFAHISQHLQTTPSCPVCIVHLTPEALRSPAGFLKNYWEDMKINCNYNERGCPDYIRLENLQSHVGQCGFAPMICTNEGCEMEINRRDQDIHERNYCQFSIAKCHDCSDIKESQEQSKARLDEMKMKLSEAKVHIAEIETKQNQIYDKINPIKVTVDEMKQSQNEMKRKQNQINEKVNEITENGDEMKRSQIEMKASQNEIKIKQDQINEKVNQITEHGDEVKQAQAEIKESQIKMERKQDQIQDKVDLMKGNIDEVKESRNKIERKQDQIQEKVEHMKANVDEIKQTQTEMKADQVALKTEIRQQFEQMKEMMKQMLQASNNTHGAQALGQAVAVHSVINQDIIILGGWYAPGLDKVLNTAETFNIVEGNSVQSPPMNHPRAESATCVYNNDVIVAGGYDGKAGTDTIEILKMNQHPLQWRIFDAKLPAKLSGHSVIVYLDKLIIIAGYNWSEKKTWNAIYELRLTPPYTSKLLVRMPQSRRNHRTELVNGKLYILGGTTTQYAKDAIDSVLVYDFLTNECKPCASLPRGIWGISTVTWGNMIIVVGGKDKNDEALNDVIMYDTETGRCEKLPSLIYKRSGCSAVIMADVIIIFGGCNREQGFLDSVERFTGSDGWKELPLRMKEKRHCATAVVKPHN